MPPQFIPSPSEQRGFVWRQSPLFAYFTCATVLVLILGFAVAIILSQLFPTFGLSLNSEPIIWFAVAVWLFIGAVLQASDIQRGAALSGCAFSSPITPLLIALFGFICLVVGIVRVLNLR
jgi:hypothetical protein